jgi:hypothetical protein
MKSILSALSVQITLIFWINHPERRHKYVKNAPLEDNTVKEIKFI